MSGLEVESIGDLWVAFSPLSGESHLLNDASVAILEFLTEHGPRAAALIVDELALLTGSPRNEVAELCTDTWPTLVAAGLIREARPQ